MPFDRFVEAVDKFVLERNIQAFIQIGKGSYIPKYAEWDRLISHDKYIEKLKRCEIFVAHCGMGSILQALEFQKRIICMPRDYKLREHTTDHQNHTAKRFRETPGITIAYNRRALEDAMTRALKNKDDPVGKIPEYAGEQMIEKIRSFVFE